MLEYPAFLETDGRESLSLADIFVILWLFATAFLFFVIIILFFLLAELSWEPTIYLSSVILGNLPLLLKGMFDCLSWNLNILSVSIVYCYPLLPCILLFYPIF
jgi:glucan phosphoethanolaminetransferase (alkaline phosphatase superfamily)